MSPLYRLLLHQEVTDFTVKLHFDYDYLHRRPSGWSVWTSNNRLLKTESLGSASKQEAQNNESGPRRVFLSRPISEVPPRCESSLLSSCFELGNASYLKVVTAWFIALCLLESNLALSWSWIQTTPARGRDVSQRAPRLRDGGIKQSSLQTKREVKDLLWKRQL